MLRTRILIQSLIPWLLLFILYDFKLPIIGSILFILIFNFSSLRRGLIFDWGTLIFFLFLLFVTIFFPLHWFLINITVVAIYAIALIIWLSIFLKKPIAMQYAQLSSTKALSKTHLFYKIYNFITLFWAIILTILAILTTIQLFLWQTSMWLSELLPIAFLLIGFWFTFWFPNYYKKNIIGEWGVMNIRNLSNLHIAHAKLANIAYRSLGKGPKLILLPASYMNMYAWDPILIRKLAKRYQVILIDYPNIGESKLKQGDFSVENLAAVIFEFIENLTEQKISILGYSMGGWIAQKIAIEYPSKINKLILIATNVGSARAMPSDSNVTSLMTNKRLSVEKEAEPLMHVMFPTHKIKSMLPKMRTLFSSADFSGRISTTAIHLENELAQKWYSGAGTYRQLGEIDALTLVITGIQDKIVNRQNAALLANNIRRAKFIEIADAGHGIIYEYPDKIANSILNL